ncbi:MAG: methyltransferase domain-containing protein [Chloroflexi bacterium]|nr:methyltransferase domain-containing protein [Ardenticatenaceae bacterium]MBL1128326.1 class I SAM-dependent methyltransferase [Chloroflexota bacterium]NOG34401.1 methyltransferase domain-containing protein [Chloroflexota bacterium]GIK55970.1 MAG: type 11 methyltransferase [Chloroflexota bacterium]
MTDETWQRFADRYNAGPVPWDNTEPPPEVITLVTSLTPGRALDLGCGYGRTTIYLAQYGWLVDGVDFIPQAIAEARQRAAAAGVSEKATFYEASVTELGFLPDRYQLAIDVGCLHALTEPQRWAYQAELTRLLEPGATYLLFARLGARDGEEGPRGIEETAVHTLFAADFALEKSEIGVTHVEDKSWPSGWFWFRRLNN